MLTRDNSASQTREVAGLTFIGSLWCDVYNLSLAVDSKSHAHHRDRSQRVQWEHHLWRLSCAFAASRIEMNILSCEYSRRARFNGVLSKWQIQRRPVPQHLTGINPSVKDLSIRLVNHPAVCIGHSTSDSSTARETRAQRSILMI